MNIPESTKSISMVAVVVAVTALVLAGCDSAGAGGGGGGGGSDVTLGTSEYVINYSTGDSEAGTGTYTYLTQPFTVVSLIPDAATGQEHAFNFHPGSGAPDGNADGLATGTYQITNSYDSSDSSAQVVWIVDNVSNGYTAPFYFPTATDGTIPVSGTITVSAASTNPLSGTFEGTFENVVMDTDDDLNTTGDQITINGSFVLSPL